MSNDDILIRLQETDYEPVCKEALVEIERLRSLVKELLPYMMLDMDQGLITGRPPEDNSHNWWHSEWYKESLAWKERIDSGEFDEFRS